jgi:hypothetical protein
MPGVCEVHGPYDGPACPYSPPHTDSARGRPARPNPLADDDLVTDPGGSDDNEATGPTLARGSRKDDGEAETEIGGRRGRFEADAEEDELTVVDKGLDETQPPLDRAPKPTLGLLWVKEGTRPGKIYPLRDGTVIGRQWEKEGDLVLDERGVSGRHAKFKLEKSQFEIWDMGSSFGTFVNGRQIREATVLEENDLVKIGETVFLVKLLESKPRRRTPPKKPARKSTGKKSKS